jgi:FkbM family methyltransferase
MFDVGSNVGEWSLEAVHGLPSSTRLFVFEPSRETFELLQAKLSRAAVRVTAHNFALGDSESSAPLYVDVRSQIAGTNSLHKRRAEVYFNLHQSATLSVRVRRGDSVATEAGIERIHFLKIDTEGHEVAVLAGFSGMMAENRIDFVQFEYGSAWADARTLLVDAFDLLQKYGYLIGRLHPRGVEFFPKYDQREETFAFANYVAVRPGLESILGTV